MMPLDRKHVWVEEVCTIPSIADTVKSTHRPIIQSKRNRDESVRRLYCYSASVFRRVVYPFNGSSIVEEEDPAIQYLGNPIGRR